MYNSTISITNQHSKKQHQKTTSSFTSNSDYFCAKRYQKETTSTTAELPSKSYFTKMKEKKN